MFENSNFAKTLCDGSFVEPQYASEAGSTIDPVRFRTLSGCRHNQIVVQALMVSLQMVVLHIFAQGAAEHECTNRYQFR
jgi:hypothetical protein